MFFTGIESRMTKPDRFIPIAIPSLMFKVCAMLTLYMSFSAENGSVHIFVSNYVSDFAMLIVAS
jgi:hypothetical protein